MRRVRREACFSSDGSLRGPHFCSRLSCSQSSASAEFEVGQLPIIRQERTVGSGASQAERGSYAAPPSPRSACGHKASGAGRRQNQFAHASAFNSASRNERPTRPGPRSPSRPAESWNGPVHVRARSRQTSPHFILPQGIPARPRPRIQPELADAFNAASGSRSPGQFRHGGPSFFPGSFCSLWRHLPPGCRCADGARLCPP